MKKLLIFIVAAIMFTVAVSAQSTWTTGWNGVGFYKYATEADKLALLDASGPITEHRFRIDKDLYVNTQSIIDFVNLYKENGKVLQVVVTAKANNPELNFRVVDSLYKAGITPYVELGNERYASQFNHTFFTYIGEFQSTINAIKAMYPNTTFLVNAVPRPEGSSIPGPKKGSGLWNAAAYDYCVANQARVSWHTYINNKDTDILDTVPSSAKFDTLSVGENIINFYNELSGYKENLSSQTIDYLDTYFPNIYVHFTEIGIVPSDDESLDNADIGTSQIRNTVAYSNLIYQLLNGLTSYEYTASVDIHAGISLSGLIAPPSKYDVSVTNVKKMEYYSFELFNETGPLEPLPMSLSFQGEGLYVYRFNYGQSMPVVVVPKGYSLTTTCRYVGGNPWLTSGGSGYMGKGTGKINPYKGIEFCEYIPADGYGYVEYSVNLVIVPGCTDPAAKNYNAEANDDDGSCVYTPIKCLKKRWLFTSLPCKPAKKDCNCN